MNTIIGWAMTLIVFAAVLFAWADPVSGSSSTAAVFVVGAVSALTRARASSLPQNVTHGTALLALLAAAIGALQLAAGTTEHSFLTQQAAASWAAVAVLITAVYASFDSREKIRGFRTSCIWAGAAISATAVLHWQSKSGLVLWIFDAGVHDEIAATFLNRDHYAALIELLFPIAASAAMAQSRHRVWITIAAALMASSVIMTGSRGGSALIAAETIVLLAIFCARGAATWRRAGLLVASVFCCIAIVGHEYLLFRLRLQDPFASRIELWQSTIAMISARPLTGFGLGAWAVVYPSYAVFDPPGVFMNHAHSDWMQALAEGGVAMGIVLAGITASAVALARKQTWGLGVAAVLIHAAFDYPLQKTAVFFATALVLAVMAAASTVDRRAAERRNSGSPLRLEPQPTRSLHTTVIDQQTVTS